MGYLRGNSELLLLNLHATVGLDVVQDDLHCHGSPRIYCRWFLLLLGKCNYLGGTQNHLLEWSSQHRYNFTTTAGGLVVVGLICTWISPQHTMPTVVNIICNYLGGTYKPIYLRCPPKWYNKLLRADRPQLYLYLSSASWGLDVCLWSYIGRFQQYYHW